MFQLRELLFETREDGNLSVNAIRCTEQHNVCFSFCILHVCIVIIYLFVMSSSIGDLSAGPVLPTRAYIAAFPCCHVLLLLFVIESVCCYVNSFASRRFE
jgi:hypothetical protein